jgi:prepilin signal peptidase PulO-like enzyme (type II secretory pathway)
MMPFWTSIALLSLVQGAVVAVPGALGAPRLARLSGRRWAAVPPASVIAFVFAARAAERASTQGLSYIALCTVPVLAALALGWLAWDAHPPRPARALLIVPLFALAWADRGGLAGESAALALSALSCVTLGVLLAAVTPPRWLAAGIVAMAVADTALVVSEQLQRPNNALNAAHPAAGLPRLQSAVLGTAAMGYGDLFVAGALGALLAVTVGRSLQVQAAALTALLALAFDLLFVFVNELPATVPVALTLLILLVARRRRRSLSFSSSGALQPGERDRGSRGRGPEPPPAPPARHPAVR